MTGALSLLRAALTLQLALAAGAAIWAALRLDPGERVRWGRRLLLLALLSPLLAPLLPVDAPYTPPAQLWAARSWREPGPVLTVGASGRPTPTVLPARTTLGAGVVVVVALGLAGGVGLARATLGARRLLAPSVLWRRTRGVEIRVSPGASAPCTLWLGRSIIVLDPASFADPELRLLALRHELQHLRAGDASFAWVLALTGALSFANPAAAWWRRRLAEAEELACDRDLLARGVSARRYAEALYAVAARATPLAFPGLVSPRPSLLKRRIEAVLKPPTPNRSPLSRALALLGLPLVLSVAWAGDRALATRTVSSAELIRVARQMEPEGGFPLVVNAAVVEAAQRLIATPGGRAWVQAGLARYPEHGPAFEQALAARGLPRALSAIPLIESGYQNLTGAELDARVPEQSRGAGYWMFIRSTAREYGLVVDGGVDERLDVAKETEAAIDLLSDNHARYGDWGLALAAYNQGPNAVDAAIRAGGTRDVFALQEKGLLNDYVAQVVVAALLIEDPSLVGL